MRVQRQAHVCGGEVDFAVDLLLHGDVVRAQCVEAARLVVMVDGGG